MNNITIINKVKDPELLVVTPLLPEDKISKLTKKTIRRNNVNFFWLSSAGNNNIPTNALNGINWYKNNVGKLPPYYIMIDRDIELGRGMLDRLILALKRSKGNIGYAYATFQFKGHINRDFPAQPFDINRLVQSNYISSNSMFKMDVIQNVKLVTDDKYKRLLDYAFLLKCFRFGYVGIPVVNAWFIAHSTKKDISAGSNDDYKLKYSMVYRDFILPLIKDQEKNT